MESTELILAGRNWSNHRRLVGILLSVLFPLLQGCYSYRVFTEKGYGQAGPSSFAAVKMDDSKEGPTVESIDGGTMPNVSFTENFINGPYSNVTGMEFRVPDGPHAIAAKTYTTGSADPSRVSISWLARTETVPCYLIFDSVSNRTYSFDSHRLRENNSTAAPLSDCSTVKP